MANGLSMKVLLQLQKQQFDKGINEVKNSITGLGRTVKSVAGMIVGGLGLSSLVSQFKDTATQMSIVKNTLENVSADFKEYSDNMQFVQRIAKDYGQDQIALANGFAKFHAAAKQTNLSLDQQRFIYEALTRSAGAFHLSADQTSNVMLAVEQMLSKGKVAAEELRRQLGNSLPGAFNLMAEAAGAAGLTLNGTTAELESAMKAGKIISEKVLPEFAKVLNRTTQNANFDSLQSSLNRFKNSWAIFVDKSGFEKIFKGLVDFGTKSFDALAQKSVSVGKMIMTGLGAVLGSQIPKAIVKFREEGERNLPPIVKDIKGITKGLENTDFAIKEVESEFNALKNSSDKTHTGLVGREDIKFIQNLSKEEENLLKKITARGHQVAIEEDRYDALCRLDNKRNDLLKQRGELQGKLAQYDESAITSAKNVNVALEGAKSIGRAFLSTVAGIATSMAAAFAVSLVVNWIMKIVEAANEAKKLKNIVEDTHKEVEKNASAVNDQIVKMDTLYKTVNDVRNSEALREQALKEINGLLGSQVLSMDDIKHKADLVNSSINAWKQGMIAAARASAYTGKIIELESRRIDLETQKNAITNTPGYEKFASHAVMNGAGIKTPVGAMTESGKQVAKLEEQIAGVDKAIEALNKSMQEDSVKQYATSMKSANEVMNKYGIELYKLKDKLKNGTINQQQFNEEEEKISKIARASITSMNGWSDMVQNFSNNYKELWKNIQKYGGDEGGSNGGDAGKKIKTLSDILDEFADDKKKVDNQLKNGALSEEEYEKEIAELIEKYKDDIYSVEDLMDKVGKLGKKQKEVFEYIQDGLLKISLADALEAQSKELENAIKENDENLQKEMDKSLDKIEKYLEKSAEIMAEGIPEKKKTENGFFAYKDGLHESLGRYAKDSENYVKELEKIKNKILELKKLQPLDPAMQSMLDEIIKRLNIAKNEARGLRDAANFAELSEDIKQLKKELGSDLWDVWSEGIVGAAGRITSAFESMNDAFGGDLFDEEFMEGFTRVLEGISALNDVVETVSHTFQVFNQYLETNKKLQEAQAAMTTLTSGVKRKALAAETVAEATSAAATQSSEAAKTAAINTTTTALAGQALAGAASSTSWLPIVGPALAVAAVGALAAVLASKMDAFAKGGIVGGNSTQGDNQMVRVNSQEMILNRAQQANLWSIINGKRGFGGNVEFKIRGDQLIGCIQNHQSRMRG